MKLVFKREVVTSSHNISRSIFNLAAVAADYQDQEIVCSCVNGTSFKIINSPVQS